MLLLFSILLVNILKIEKRLRSKNNRKNMGMVRNNGLSDKPLLLLLHLFS